MIYVFKTSVETEKDIERLRSYLNDLLPGAQWTFDIEDCDNILRVDTLADSPEMIIRVLKNAGFECEKLTY